MDGLMKNQKIETAPWLTNLNEIRTASAESLIRSLCTSDGKGSDFKKQVLGEVILRIIEEQLRIRGELPAISLTD
jgi:hypothetical protein